MELQQSSLYAKYIEALHWKVIRLDGVNMFYKHIPLAGGLLKIQRPKTLPRITRLRSIIKEYHIRSVAVEPIQGTHIPAYKTWCTRVAKYCRVSRSDFMSTKTICIDLKPAEEEIFRRFSEAKRRAVRKAQKNGVTVRESNDIKDLIRIKNRSGGFLGFITTVGIDKFWNIFAPKHATVLLAYRPHLIGGVLLVFWNTTAFYWIAGATKEGKKLFAPTLLVWEALKIAKKRGAKQFDFLGVWDERRATEHLEWKGFTKFKEGFGGKPFNYPVY